MTKRVVSDILIIVGLLLLAVAVYDHWRLMNVCHVVPQACWGIPPAGK